MQLLLEINETAIGLNEVESFSIRYKLRKAVRAVLFNQNNEIALLHASKNHYHKLPGGGIESGENIEIALEREIMEEVGSKIAIQAEIGAIIEYRNQFQMMQVSYCFIAKTVGNLQKTSFTQEEKDSGFKLLWLPLNDAIATLSQDQPVDYFEKFVQKRDLTFLVQARQIGV